NQIAKMKLLWADPSWKAARGAAISKAKLSSVSGRKSHVAAMKALWKDPVWRESQIAAIVKSRTSDYKLRQSAVIKKYWTPERKAEQSVRMRKVLADPRTRHKKSKLGKRNWRDPVYRQRISDAVRHEVTARWKRPGYKEKVKINQSRTHKEQWNDPDWRKYFLTCFARSMRKRPTGIEDIMSYLLNRLGVKYQCQVVLHNCIVDFLVPLSRLVIECDGPRHNHPDNQRRDAFRDLTLRAYKYRVARFTSEQLIRGLARSEARLRKLLKLSKSGSQ